VADYSEFPTTPTAWQEAQARDWQTVMPLETEDPPPPRRADRFALVPGIFFVALALVFMTGLDLPVGLFAGGGILWLVLIGAGVALLVRELRTARRRR
jgi:hypothetical protein